eukprot:m.8563 g.8563  ORF g.8563 m.8563 type:complete len:430 (+) comp20702_c0_seq2:115-1404(+)
MEPESDESDFSFESDATVESNDQDPAPSAVCCPRRAHEAVMVGPRLLIFGGYCLQNFFNRQNEFQRQSVYSFDTVRNAWQLHNVEAELDSPVPPPCTGAKAVAVGRTVYSFAGLVIALHDYTRNFSSFVFALNTVTMSWRLCAVKGSVRPVGRDKCAVCVDGSRVLMFGGWGMAISGKELQPGAMWVPDDDGIVGWNNELYAFDTESESWSSLEVYGPRPSPRAAHSLVKLDSHRVVLFGGRERERRLNDIHILDLRTMTWSGQIVAPADPTILWPSARSLHTMNSVSFGSHAGCVLLGGMDVEGNCCSDYAWHLDFNDMKWTKLTWYTEEFRRTWHTTCTYSSSPGYFEVYVFGGSPNNIWKPHSRDLGGPEFTSFGVKSLYFLAMEAACKFKNYIANEVDLLPRRIKDEFWLRLSGFNMRNQPHYSA